MEAKTPLEQFRLDNGLRKKVVADYLGISPQFIGKICEGVNKLPQDKLDKLLKNDRGWDTSALINFPPKEEPELLANPAGMEILNQLMETLADLGETQKDYIVTLKMKDELLAAKDQQIARMTEIIATLTQTLANNPPK